MNSPVASSTLAAVAVAAAVLGAATEAQERDIPVLVLARGGPAAEPDRHAETARATIQRFDEWLRPYPYDRLIIREAPWYSPLVGAASPGDVVAPDRWLLRTSDRSADRVLIGAIARQYWPHLFQPDAGRDAWFFDGLRQYLAVRAIHESFAGTHYYSQRYFGGSVPHMVRAVLLSRNPEDPRPQVRWFPELASQGVQAPDALVTYARSRGARVVDAMFTLERYLGWPTLQQAIAATSTRGTSSALVPADFVSTVNEVSGRSLDWFFDAVFRGQAMFDYGVTAFSSEGSAVAAGTFETSVTVARLGDAVFPVDLSVSFEDATEMRERWDGRSDSRTFQYTSRSRATAARADPERILLLDRNRTNNVRTVQPAWHIPAIRWTLQWLVWLEDAMLTYSAFI